MEEEESSSEPSTSVFCPLIYKLGDEVADTLGDVLCQRGWVQWNSAYHLPHEWNLMWSTKRIVARDLHSLHPHQKVNHFKLSSGITKKDCLVRNIRRMRGNFTRAYDFVPKSYTFPRQYAEFVADDKLNLGGSGSSSFLWIAKPSHGRRGTDIHVFQKLSSVPQSVVNGAYVVQRYIQRPLLIGGYKFDLRLYVLVSSFRPLKVWLYREGLVRFGTELYSLDDLSNRFAHLTNASVNKSSQSFANDKPVIGRGAKWTLSQLWAYLLEEQPAFKPIHFENIWPQIRDIVILTLLPIVAEVQGTSNCFELFGFDILIDSNGKCWLLEVNGSPAIAVSSRVDAKVKPKLLTDVLECVGAGKPIDWRRQEFKATIKRRHSDIRGIQSSSKKKAKMRHKPQVHRYHSLGSVSSGCGSSNSSSTMSSSNSISNQSDSTRTTTSGIKGQRSAVEWTAQQTGDFEQVFPFNAETHKLNATIKYLEPKAYQRKMRQFNKGVVSQIMARRKKVKSPSSSGCRVLGRKQSACS